MAIGRPRPLLFCGCACLITASVSVRPAMAQGPVNAITLKGVFNDQPGPFRMKWQRSPERLLLYRNPRPVTAQAVLAYLDFDREPLAVSPARDFPKAKGFQVWAVASTAEGGTITSLVREDSERRLSHLILTYDVTGKLIKVWDVFPYSHQEISVSSDGSVFAFGTRVDRSRDDVSRPYPMLIKYSTRGKVLRESLPSSVMNLDAVLNLAQLELTMVGERLALLVRSTFPEILWFDDDATLLSRVSLRQFIETVSAPGPRAVSFIHGLAARSDGTLMAQMLFTKTTGASTAPMMSEEVYNIAKDGRTWTLVSKTGEASGRLIGLDKQERPIRLSWKEDAGVSLHRE